MDKNQLINIGFKYSKANFLIRKIQSQLEFEKEFESEQKFQVLTKEARYGPVVPITDHSALKHGNVDITIHPIDKYRLEKGEEIYGLNIKIKVNWRGNFGDDFCQANVGDEFGMITLNTFGSELVAKIQKGKFLTLRNIQFIDDAGKELNASPDYGSVIEETSSSEVNFTEINTRNNVSKKDLPPDTHVHVKVPDRFPGSKFQDSEAEEGDFVEQE